VHASHGNGAWFLVSLAGSVLDLVFPFGGALRQPITESLNRIKQQFHATGVERDRPTFNIRAQVYHHLIKPSQAFDSQECQHRIRVLLGVLGVNKLADAVKRTLSTA
jgi:hypothetical protein